MRRQTCGYAAELRSRSLVFTWISRLIPPLFLLCFPGFVELNHMLTSCYPPPSANSTSGRTAEASSGAEQRRERERESEGATTASRTPPFGCTEKLWNSEREFVPDWFAPGPFFLLHTYTHTSFFEKKKKKPCLNDSYHFWTQTNFYLNIGLGKVKETPSNLLTATNPAELSEEMWIQKSPARVKTFDHKKKRKRKANGGIAVGDLSERWFEIGGGNMTFEDQFIRLETQKRTLKEKKNSR